MRIGSGFDVHQLVINRPLIIGGVEIPFEKGLEGHSDADVLTHAIMDALLGALALGDIGTHFPDTSKEYEGANSLYLLKQVVQKIRDCDYYVENLDCTILAQHPKMAPYLLKMRENLASPLQIALDCLSIKATTTEKLGFVGREEGIAAQVVVLLKKVR